MTTTTRPADPSVGRAPAPVDGGTQALTAIAPILPGRQEQLRQVLAGLARRIATGGRGPLDEIGTVHFARWVILPEHGADGGLLFTSNYDGTWDEYIEDFADKAAETFQAIYSHCVDWPAGGAEDLEAFKAYIREHELEPDVYYRAYPTATVRQVQSALRLKQAWAVLVDEIND